MRSAEKQVNRDWKCRETDTRENVTQKPQGRHTGVKPAQGQTVLFLLQKVLESWVGTVPREAPPPAGLSWGWVRDLGSILKTTVADVS
jgi:hypothetical protein